MKTLRPLLVFSGFVALAVSPATSFASFTGEAARIDGLPRFDHNPAKINLIDGSRAKTALPQLKVAFTLTAQGEPTAIRVLAGTDDETYDAQCVAALQTVRFAPKLVDGVAVSSEQTAILAPKFARTR